MDTKKIETVLTTVTIDSKVDSGKIDVVVGESAKMDVVKAVNYIQSGKAEIEKAVNQGKTVISDHTTEKIGEFDQNAQDKTGDFNTNAINKTTDFNDNYTAKKDVIDGLVDDASDFADLSKQWAIGEPSEPTGGSSKYWAEEAATTLANKQDKLTVGTGIDITSNVISVTSPALINTATYPTDSIALITASTNSAHNAVAVGYNSIARDFGGVAIGTHAKSYNNGASVGGSAEATGSKAVAVGYSAKAQSSYSIQIGQGTNTEVNSLYVGTSSSNNYKMLDDTGLIPDARISTNIARTSAIPSAYGAGLSYISSSLQLLDQNGNNLGSAVTIKSTPDLDGVTIDTNSDDELEAIGVVNKNTAVGATAVKYDWIGTLAEYNSQNVETLHPEWVCYITDDVSGGTSVYTKTETDSAISNALDNVYTKSAVDTLISGLLANTTSTVTSNYIRLGDWLVHWGISSTMNVPASGFASQQITLSPAFANSGYTVILNHIDAGSGYANTVPQANKRTPNSFEIYCWGQGGAGVTNIAWVAIGKGA